jgi:CRP/FNR family transcriptional regulator, nitrogen fixation regulation protein
MQPATTSASVPGALLTGGPRARLIEELGTIRAYDAEETVYSKDEAADSWYLLMGGAARKCAQISDGRRQIMDFLLPGDLFGFEVGTRRECSVECVVPGTKVKRYRRPQMESLLEKDPKLAREVREIAFSSIERLQSRMILLGRSRALERVCGFLLEMTHRAQVETEGSVVLPMSRYDIADYLAIAVETVSRSLTTLRSERVITFFDTRHFRIINRRALEAHCCR